MDVRQGGPQHEVSDLLWNISHRLLAPLDGGPAIASCYIAILWAALWMTVGCPLGPICISG